MGKSGKLGETGTTPHQAASTNPALSIIHRLGDWAKSKPWANGRKNGAPPFRRTIIIIISVSEKRFRAFFSFHLPMLPVSRSVQSGAIIGQYRFRPKNNLPKRCPLLPVVARFARVLPECCPNNRSVPRPYPFAHSVSLPNREETPQSTIYNLQNRIAILTERIAH